MNKLLKVLAASALVATALVGCGKKDEGGATTAAKYAKAGLGVVSTYSDGQVNSTIAAVGLDADGKIQYCYLDVAQSTPADEAKAKEKTKKELQDEYGMKKASGIQKEWFEQAAALEEYVVGKTAADVAKIETEDKGDGHHTAVPKAGSDLAAGCTMDIGAFKEAIAKAVANASDAQADKLGVGHVMSNDATKGQVNTTIALVGSDKDGKVVYSKIDVAQISETVLQTKSERKDDYGMKKASGIGKEWFEQAEALETFIKGKTAADIAAIETEDKGDGHHTAVPKSGSDLAAGCTMDIGYFKTAIADAMK